MRAERNHCVSITDLWSGLFPRGSTGGKLAMLWAYLDDSGSHDNSDIVIIAGILGTESELLSLEGMWKDHLSRPLCGLREQIKEFRAHDCYHSRGEFLHWKRHETDYFRHQLRCVLIKSKVSGYGFACKRKEWNEFLQGDARSIFGDPEGYAARQCFVRMLRMANETSFDPYISFVFDNKPNREREIRVVFDAFQRIEKDKNIVGISFMDSAKILPLQAADLFAWEFNFNARLVISKGINKPISEGAIHLRKMYRIEGQITGRDGLAKLADYIKKHSAGDVSAYAHHFDTFDPRNEA